MRGRPGGDPVPSGRVGEVTVGRGEASDGARYTFGDDERAARRLQLLSDVLAASSVTLLDAWATPSPALAVDLGSGPGHSTALVAARSGAGRTVGLDQSPTFVAEAATRASDAGVPRPRRDDRAAADDGSPAAVRPPRARAPRGTRGRRPAVGARARRRRSPPGRGDGVDRRAARRARRVRDAGPGRGRGPGCAHGGRSARRRAGRRGRLARRAQRRGRDLGPRGRGGPDLRLQPRRLASRPVRRRAVPAR